MPSEPEKTTDEPGPPLSAAEVRTYLEGHPDFMAENPKLLAILTPPALRRDGPVVDMQRFMIDRLQDEVRQLNSTQRELIAASRNNMATQSQIHAAVLALLQARSFENLISIVTNEFTDRLELDAVALCVEADETTGGSPKVTKAGVHVVGKGVIDSIIGEGRDILLRPSAAGDKAIYRSRAGLVCSDALIRLNISAKAPVGLLALGAAEEEKFHPGQGTELLAFLAKSLEYCIRAWLNLPR